MPESDSLLWEKAIIELEDSIKLFYGYCLPLNNEELDIHKNKGYHKGWKVEFRVSGYCLPCHLLINHSFPFSSPRFFVQDYSIFLKKIPHLGNDGILCLGETGYDYFYGRRSIKALHNKAYALLNQGLIGECNHDFQDEFLNYWCLGADFTAYACINNLLSIPFEIVYCDIDGRVYFFNNQKSGREWLNKRFPNQKASNSAKSIEFRPTICFPVEEIWFPNEYPTSGKDILSLAKAYGQNFINMLLECTPCQGEHSLPILFSFQVNSSPTFVATEVYEPRTSRGPGKTQFARNSRRKVNKSARIGDQGLPFFTSSAHLSNMNVQRVDSAWLHYRGGEGKSNRQHELTEVKVAILGCGALGAQVADTLCKAGIGTVALFDPDILSWDNLYRHLLGPEFVGQNKAEALANFLQQKFPEANIQGFSSKWEKHFSEGVEPRFQQYELIVSLIGEEENNVEQLLSYCTHNVPNFPRIIFGWTEVWGAAGHALLMGHLKGDGCLMCADNGETQLRNVFSFETDQTLSTPACSTVFAPYGYIDTLPIVSMISGLALEILSEAEVVDNYRIWISCIEKIKKAGGELNQWIESKFGRVVGEQIIRSKWVPDKNCGVCNANQIQGD